MRCAFIAVGLKPLGGTKGQLLRRSGRAPAPLARKLRVGSEHARSMSHGMLLRFGGRG